MFVCCPFIVAGILGDGLGLLPLVCRIAWIRPDSSVVEMKEVIQEPARIEDCGIQSTSSQSPR